MKPIGESRILGVVMVVGGSIALAVGIGLVPQVLENFPSIAAAVSLLTLVGGLAVIVRGVRIAVSGKRRWVKVASGFGAVLVMALAAMIVGPAVAATNVPPSSVTTTPDDVDLEADDVSLTTADGVRLAGWYAAGSTDAAIVVLHGAGSTRSAALDEASVLHRNGFGVLLVDARGHGDSDGTAMDFGWYGSSDIAAATEFLARRPEVARIGLLGLSMGGEEAIGAASTDTLVSAIVAEGATGRTAADKSWLSDVFGWRGWVQERIESVQYGVTDLLTDASPPPPLAESVAGATETSFLLITASEMPDEGHAAEHMQAAAPDRVDVWTVEGAGHTGGLRTDPDEWESRVVTFLESHLRST